MLGIILFLACILGGAWFIRGLLVKEEPGYTPPPEEVDALQARAELGDADAQCQLGNLYRDGRGVPQDDVAAVDLYKLAADQGFSSGMSDLAIMHQTGSGVPEDHVQASMWWMLAAKRTPHPGLDEVYMMSCKNQSKGMSPEQWDEAVRLFREMNAKLPRFNKEAQPLAPEWDPEHPRES